MASRLETLGAREYKDTIMCFTLEKSAHRRSPQYNLVGVIFSKRTVLTDIDGGEEEGARKKNPLYLATLAYLARMQMKN